MNISFVVAMDRHRAIGRDNQLPWHLPADLKYFRQLTSHHTILMGRKTYESIGKPLPNRTNVVLTQRTDYVAPGCEMVHSLEDALRFGTSDELFVIGGAEVFRALFPIANRMYITWIDDEFVADTYFPAFDDGKWQLTSRTPGERNEQNPYTYEFQVYERV
jgi:dihydrofolate reductase